MLLLLRDFQYACDRRSGGTLRLSLLPNPEGALSVQGRATKSTLPWVQDVIAEAVAYQQRQLVLAAMWEGRLRQARANTVIEELPMAPPRPAQAATAAVGPAASPAMQAGRAAATVLLQSFVSVGAAVAAAQQGSGIVPGPEPLPASAGAPFGGEGLAANDASRGHTSETKRGFDNYDVDLQAPRKRIRLGAPSWGGLPDDEAMDMT